MSPYFFREPFPDSFTLFILPGPRITPQTCRYMSAGWCQTGIWDRDRQCLQGARDISKQIQTWKLTFSLKRDYLNRKYIFQPLIFRGHVSFRGWPDKKHPKVLHPQFLPTNIRIWDALKVFQTWPSSAMTPNFSKKHCNCTPFFGLKFLRSLLICWQQDICICLLHGAQTHLHARTHDLLLAEKKSSSKLGEVGGCSAGIFFGKTVLYLNLNTCIYIYILYIYIHMI